MQKFFSFIAGVLSGAVVGGVTALLLAPSSGEELVGSVRSQGEGLMDSLKSSIAEERKRLEDELEALKRGEINIS